MQNCFRGGGGGGGAIVAGDKGTSISEKLDISRQLACMKLGSREIYQPIQYCWVHTCRLLGYLVHTCHLPIDIQQVSCSTPDRTAGQHAALMLPCLGYCNLYMV